jgi:hypothetical protein
LGFFHLIHGRFSCFLRGIFSQKFFGRFFRMSVSAVIFLMIEAATVETPLFIVLASII